MSRLETLGDLTLVDFESKVFMTNAKAETIYEQLEAEKLCNKYILRN